MKAKQLTDMLVQYPNFEVRFRLLEPDGSFYGLGMRTFDIDIDDIGYSSETINLGPVSELRTVTSATDPLIEELAEKVTDRYCKDELLKEMAEALDKSVRSLSELIGYSRGVDGLHLNGDVATWESLRTGGCYESWLIEFDEAASFLQKYHEQVGDTNAK